MRDSPFTDRDGLDVSIVVPVYNEQAALIELHRRIAAAMAPLGKSWELILVNDGSTDETAALMAGLADGDDHVVCVELARRFGQTAALAAGFDTARGQVVISMDGDLQHDPAEIPRFLAAIAEGYDVVSGWRRRRVDGLLDRRVPSRVVNWAIARISGLPLHDFGTTFKAYRGALLRQLRLYGDMHRYIPALAAQQGARVCEIESSNVPRPHGASNYRLGRAFGVFLDLMSLRFFLKYVSCPLRFFGKIGLTCWAAAAGLAIYLLIDKFVYNQPIFGEHGPLSVLTVLLAVLGSVIVSTGLIGEMVSRVYHETTGRKVYAIRTIRRSADRRRAAVAER